MTPHEGGEISKDLWKFFERHFPDIESEKIAAMTKESLAVFEARGYLDPIDQKKEEKA